MRLPFRTVISLQIGVLVVLVAAIAWASYAIAQNVVRAGELARHSTSLQLALRNTLIILIDAETGERGYIITGDEAYLEPYRRSLVALGPQIEVLSSLTELKPEWKENIDALRALTREKVEELARTIEIRQTQGLPAAAAEVQTHLGKSKMDQIRHRIEEMGEIIDAEVMARDATRRAERAKLIGLTAVLNVLLIGLLLAGYLRFRLLSAHRERLNAELLVARADIEKRAGDLEAANKELEAFSYSVSHDLRAPLRATTGFSRILIEDYSDKLEGDAKRYLNLIYGSGLQMGQLIDDLLSFSRLGRQELKRSPTSLSQLARQAGEAAAAQADGRRIDLTIDEVPVVRCDTALFKQVFQNLMENAVKFTRPREVAQIHFGSKPGDDGRPIYFVRDNGVGFDMQYVHKLFGVFQRLHLPEEYEGTGVGLAIVQRVVHRHGGLVWAEGTPDSGATFYFTIAEEPAV